MERFGIAPVRNIHWQLEEEDILVRDLVNSTACPIQENDDIEDFEGIAIEIKDGEIKTSQGFEEFFKMEFEIDK